MNLRSRNSHWIVAATAILLFPVLAMDAWAAPDVPAGAEAGQPSNAAAPAADALSDASVEELQRQLEAQQRINAQLRQRVVTLEETVLRLRTEAVVVDPGPAPEPRSAGDAQYAAGRTLDDGEEEGGRDALEQALVQRGSSVLAPGSMRVSSGVAWTHTGSSFIGTESDSYIWDLSAQMGLPMGTMVGLRIPYILYAENPNGHNNGVGDLSFSLAKEVVTRDQNRPSLLARLEYRLPTGADPFEIDVPLGSGFHAVRAGLSSTYAIDPLVFYGDVSYTHAFQRSIGGSDLRPGDTIGLGVGSTLAATPDIALSLGMSLAFVDTYEMDAAEIPGSDRTIGTVNLGAGIVLSRDAYLSLTGRVGATDDAPDLGLGAALALRF